MDYKKWYIGQFRDTLNTPLDESDAIPDSALEVIVGGKRIPQSMLDYYRVAGRHWINNEHNQLLFPSAFATVDEYTIFMNENQLVLQWAILSSEVETADPMVYQGIVSDNGHEWYPEEKTFSKFIVSMWKWILTGEEHE